MRRKRRTARKQAKAPVHPIHAKGRSERVPDRQHLRDAGIAPGRIREHFNLAVEGRELKISYTPPEGFPRHDWIQREYSRGGFVWVFTLDESIEAGNITAKYADGVLQVRLPRVAGKEPGRQEIMIA